MKYSEVKILRSEKVSEDRLGNPVYEDKTIMKAPGRLTEWSADDVSINGREFTELNRKCVLYACFDKLKYVSKVMISGEVYGVSSIKKINLNRCLLHLQRRRK